MNDTTTNIAILLALLTAPILWAWRTFFRKKIEHVTRLEREEDRVEQEKEEAVTEAEAIAKKERDASTRIYNVEEQAYVDVLHKRYVAAKDPDSVNDFLKEVRKQVHGDKKDE
jgi:hypothetical protein